MRGTGLSYSVNGLFVMAVGLFAASSLSGVFELEGFGAVGGRMEEFYNAFFTDYLFVVVCGSLGVNVVCGGCVAPFLVRGSQRAIFSVRGLRVLRVCPLSAGSIVGSRLLSMLFALSFNATLFFVAAYFFTELGDLGGSYLWFVGIWLGYGLFATGLYLAFEFTVTRSVEARGGSHVLLGSFAFALALMVLIALLEWTLEVSLVEGAAMLAQSCGPLAASFSILAGCASLALLCRLTARRIERRGLSV